MNETVDNPIANVNQEMMNKADLLVHILRGRVQSFMNRRHVGDSQQKQAKIKLAYKNLSVVAAYMTLAEYVKDNFNYLDATQLLFTPNHNKVLPCQTHNDLYWLLPFRRPKSMNVGQGFGGRYGDRVLLGCSDM